MKDRTAIDLFSGCGGLSQGLFNAGFKVLACSEVRAEAQETYSKNYEGVKQLGDIRKIVPDDFLREFGLKSGELDLLAACPPCQGFSSIRTRNGFVVPDPRNELIFEVERLIKAVMPKCVLIENVPRLLYDDRLKNFKDNLALLGYQFSDGILDAQNFNVPQRRRRMILIASRYGEFGLPEQSARKSLVQDVIKNLPPPDSPFANPLHHLRQKFSPIVQARIASIKKNRTELPKKLILKCHRKYPQGFRDVYGRMSWDSVAPTITRASHNPSKGRFIHPSENRGLTAYESMLLQGFPRDYNFPVHLGLGKISSMIGEALPPPMALAQAKHILLKLDEFEKKPTI